MKKYVSPVIRGLISAYSLCVTFHAPINKAFYADVADYYTASVYELLGEYSFRAVIIWALCSLLFLYLAKKETDAGALNLNIRKKNRLPWAIVSLLFGFAYTLGTYFTQAGTDGFLGSFVNVAKVLLTVTGFALLAFPLLCFLSDGLQAMQIRSGKDAGFFSKNPFIKAFLILFLFYLPFLILSFPGNLCFDVIGQIEQVLNSSFNTHHPLVHTLLVGGCVSLGEKVFSSKEAGLFLYVILQTVLLLSAFAASVAVLAKQKVRSGFLWAMMFVYMFTPIYTNLSTTALKDIPFTAFVLFYIICYSLILSKPELILKPSVHISFAAVQIGVIVMRNNGLPLVVLSGIAALIYLLVKKSGKKIFFVSLAGFLAEGIILSELFLFLLANATGAVSGSKREIFSLPFQQTAYVLTVAEDTLTEAEKTDIENVLGDMETIKESYDETISDPVKELYNENCTPEQFKAYLKTYVKIGAKHPMLYCKSFFIHTYGWYSPAVPNEIRYEVDYTPIRQGMTFKDSDKVMVFLYRFADRIPPFGILENIGAAVWLLVFVTVSLSTRKKDAGIITFPLWVCFLICLASPCFFKHPRYALPILASLPFIFLYAAAWKNNSNHNTNPTE